MERTSVMHNIDYPEHEHEVTIYISYEIYAVCNKCGMHDWSVAEEGQDQITYLKNKYPKYRIVRS